MEVVVKTFNENLENPNLLDAAIFKNSVLNTVDLRSLIEKLKVFIEGGEEKIAIIKNEFSEYKAVLSKINIVSEVLRERFNKEELIINFLESEVMVEVNNQLLDPTMLTLDCSRYFLNLCHSLFVFSKESKSITDWLFKLSNKNIDCVFKDHLHELKDRSEKTFKNISSLPEYYNPFKSGNKDPQDTNKLSSQIHACESILDLLKTIRDDFKNVYSDSMRRSRVESLISALDDFKFSKRLSDDEYMHLPQSNLSSDGKQIIGYRIANSELRLAKLASLLESKENLDRMSYIDKDLHIDIKEEIIEITDKSQRNLEETRVALGNLVKSGIVSERFANLAYITIAKGSEKFFRNTAVTEEENSNTRAEVQAIKTKSLDIESKQLISLVVDEKLKNYLTKKELSLFKSRFLKECIKLSLREEKIGDLLTACAEIFAEHNAFTIEKGIKGQNKIESKKALLTRVCNNISSLNDLRNIKTDILSKTAALHIGNSKSKKTDVKVVPETYEHKLNKLLQHLKDIKFERIYTCDDILAVICSLKKQGALVFGHNTLSESNFLRNLARNTNFSTKKELLGLIDFAKSVDLISYVQKNNSYTLNTLDSTRDPSVRVLFIHYLRHEMNDVKELELPELKDLY